MPQFSKDALKQLRKALLKIYPDRIELAIFLEDELEENLDAIAHEGNLTKDVFKLLQWANAKDRIDELFNAFCCCNATNATVIELQQRLSGIRSSSDKTGPSARDISQDTASAPGALAATPNASQKTAKGPIEMFISYSHKDEALKDELYVHLANLTRQGKVKPWEDRAIEAGTEWDAEIKARLESAGIILLLITPRFIASDYCFDTEMQRAMARHHDGTARVIPIIMKPCDWQGTAFSKLQVLPKDAKPVTLWDNQDEALLDAVQGIRRAVEFLLGQ